MHSSTVSAPLLSMSPSFVASWSQYSVKFNALGLEYVPQLVPLALRGGCDDMCDGCGSTDNGRVSMVDEEKELEVGAADER